MAEIQLTAAQLAAVQDRDGALLVSAAAGSGKTKVLVDRLMDRICDPIRPANVNEFLIITYTKAAAAELRAKIAAELGRRLAQRPDDRHLQRQMSLVYLTEISTVHAFCSGLLRTYAHTLNIPSDFRVGEEAECRQLRERALEAVLEDAYADPQPSLRAAADFLGAGRNDRSLGEAVEALFRAALCHPDPEAWLAECRASLDLSGCSSCGETLWGRELLERFHEFLYEQSAAMEQAIADMAGIPQLENSYQISFRETLEQLKALEGLRSWDELGSAIPTSFGRLKAARGFEDKNFLSKLKAVRSRCLDGLKDWRDVFCGGDRETLEDLNRSAEALLGALELTEQFLERFAAEKRRRKMLDFSDLEQMTLRLLLQRGSGAPTAVAREIAERFVEILVDEYQDSNEIQERIFSALSKEERNRFMVGDVKQSIYRFRLADPTIFLEKYKSFTPVAAAQPGEPRKILLSENFRSRPEILDAVNHVFRAVMSERVGELNYGDDEALKAGRPFPPVAEPVVELHCMSAVNAEGVSDKEGVEARFVAARIAQLLREERLAEDSGERSIRPEDVVILLRSVSSAAPAYMAELHRLGIPCTCDKGESLFDTREVETLLSILQTIDNPRRDVALVSAMMSPIYAFSAEELAEIRAASRRGSFFDALCASELPKAAVFLEQLRSLRTQARWLPLHRFLRLVYDETRIEAVFGAMDGGARRRANLEAFFTYAADRGAGVTLMDFLDEVENRRRQGQGIPVEDSAGSGAVRIMSIHKSKGLEFPVVILADLSRRFNLEDLRRNVLTHPVLLAGCHVLDRETGVRYPSIARRAISMRLQQESISEELRVLYVAMTRAKHRLVMTYCSKYLQAELEAAAAAAARPVASGFAASVKNPGMWILAAAMTRTEAGELFALSGNPRESFVSQYPWMIRVHEPDAAQPTVCVEVQQEETAAVTVTDDETIRRKLSFRYPYLSASRVPSKVTATQLKGRAMDREASEEAAEFLPPPRRPLRRPRFIAEDRGLTPAEKGTANHLFLQFADYAACQTEEGVAGELQRMVQREFLTEKQAQAVEQARILQLFQGPLGQEILGCAQVVREMKFSLLVDGSFYDLEARGEEIMLQGVVDCLLVEKDGLTVIDFKTDAVRPGQEGERAAYYAGQLRAYALALERIYQKPVRRRLLYFLRTGCMYPITALEEDRPEL